MATFCNDKDCPACRVKAILMDLKAEGFPEEMIVPMVLDVMEEVMEEVGVIVGETIRMDDVETIH